jgi:asparagine synthase (glutamine-hydrolysing)
VSVQFGRWNFDGRPIDPNYVAKVQTMLQPYAPDGSAVCSEVPFFVLYGSFQTTEESRRERQPFTSRAGTCITWDGRLDNRSDLIGNKKARFAPVPTDFDIVSSLYEAKGTEALHQLVGDWSLSALHRRENTLVMAVDFLGARPLYYFCDERYAAWSSLLEPLAVLAGCKFTLSEEYVAGCLYGFPAASLTPFGEVHAVPPGSFVEITPRATKITKYWDFNPRERLHRSSDAYYEEGFRHFFTQAVRRRLRSIGPVVSELSGGMDSSSIVCMADRILERTPALASRLDTLSYLDDTEPDWNERPFVGAVETARKKVGFHVDVSAHVAFIPDRDVAQFPCTPSTGIGPSVPQQIVSAYFRREGTRVVLSGLGGDECTGGVPSGSPELADLLVQIKIAKLCRQAVAWSLAERRPLVHVIVSLIREFLPLSALGGGALRAKVPWLSRAFERRIRSTHSTSKRLTFFGPLPSFQENLYALEGLQRQIASAPPQRCPVLERRYPFLDRDLLEFLYSTPREQIVRPGRRRSLLRRALRGTVPAVVLERRRKAYVVRGPMKSLQAECSDLKKWTKKMLCSSIGAINLDVFQASLDDACRGNETYLWRISRTLELESWLRDQRVQSLLRLPANCDALDCSKGASANQQLVIRNDSQLGNSEKKGGETHEIREAGNHLCG